MKRLFKFLHILRALALLSPALLVWMPLPWETLLPGLAPAFRLGLVVSLRQLSVTLIATVLFAATATAVLGYLSILSGAFGKMTASLLEAIESVPSILIALFCYAPVSGYLARHGGETSSMVSLAVFILAATVTTLPEAVRGITIPLGELYHQKYSISFRSYGFRRRRILAVLMKSSAMLDAMKRTCALILLKTLVLDCSFGFIIQLGFGSYGTPAHSSPGSLIAANRDALFPGGNPALFWLPVIPLVTISLAFLLVLSKNKETAL
jgi:hypothetical protein